MNKSVCKASVPTGETYSLNLGILFFDYTYLLLVAEVYPSFTYILEVVDQKWLRKTK